jgi:hypothetical protein
MNLWQIVNAFIFGIVIGEAMVFMFLGIMCMTRWYAQHDPKLGWDALEKEFEEVTRMKDRVVQDAFERRANESTQGKDYRH